MVARSEIKIQEVSGIADQVKDTPKVTLGNPVIPGMVPDIVAVDVPIRQVVNGMRAAEPIVSVTGAGISTVAQEVYVSDHKTAVQGTGRQQGGPVQRYPEQSPAAGESGSGERGGNDRNGPPANPGEAGRGDSGGDGENGKGNTDHLGTDKFVRVIHTTCGGAGCPNCNKGFLRREKKEVVRTANANEPPEIIFSNESRTQKNLRKLPAIPLSVNVFERNREPEINGEQSAQENMDRLLRERFTDKAIAQVVGCKNIVVSDRRSILAAGEESIPTQEKISSELDRLLLLAENFLF